MDPWGLGLFFAPEDTTVTNTSGNYAVVDKKVAVQYGRTTIQ